MCNRRMIFLCEVMNSHGCILSDLLFPPFTDHSCSHGDNSGDCPGVCRAQLENGVEKALAERSTREGEVKGKQEGGGGATFLGDTPAAQRVRGSANGTSLCPPSTLSHLDTCCWEWQSSWALAMSLHVNATVEAERKSCKSACFPSPGILESL